MNWYELEGQTIKSVRMEGDLEWAKQNGLEYCVYLVLKSGRTAVLDIKEDETGKWIDVRWDGE